MVENFSDIKPEIRTDADQDSGQNIATAFCQDEINSELRNIQPDQLVAKINMTNDQQLVLQKPADNPEQRRQTDANRIAELAQGSDIPRLRSTIIRAFNDQIRLAPGEGIRGVRALETLINNQSGSRGSDLRVRVNTLQNGHRISVDLLRGDQSLGTLTITQPLP